MPYIPGNGRIEDVFHSGSVYANGVQIALWLIPTGGDSFVFNPIDSPKILAREMAINQIDGSDDEAAVDANHKKLIQEGVITQYELDLGKNAGDNPAASDTSAPANGSVPEVTSGSVTIATSPPPPPSSGRPGSNGQPAPAGTPPSSDRPASVTTGTTTIAGSVDDTLLYNSPLTGIKYYVKTVTKQPGVVFPYDVATVAPQNGLTVQQVCDNLRLLVINCFDPIKKQYPDAFMTCSFRADIGYAKSQHKSGQACDIQYKSASKADYHTRAVWIRDNIRYDQFLSEWKTTGTRMPWHHLSFNAGGNRSQVCTFMNDKNCKGPGVTGLYDLSNT
jgi:hypothetical protein